MSSFIPSISSIGIQQIPGQDTFRRDVPAKLQTDPDQFVKGTKPDTETRIMDKNKFMEAGRQILDKVINFVSNSLGVPVFFLGSIKGFAENILHKTFELVQNGFEFIKNIITELPGMIMNFISNIFTQQAQDSNSSIQK